MNSNIEAKNRSAAAKIKARIPRYDPKKQLKPSLSQEKEEPTDAAYAHIRPARKSEHKAQSDKDISKRNSQDDGENDPDFAAERQMFQQIMANDKSQGNKLGSYEAMKKKPATSRGGSASATGSDLLTQMSARLKVLEKSQREMRDELIKKEKKLLAAQRKQEAAEAALQGESEVAAEISSLREENSRLKSQVHEMETFLNDYGLIWVGNGSRRRSSGNEEDSAGDEFNPNMPYRLEFGAIKERVKELNALAGEGQKKVVHKSSGAQLSEVDTIPLTLYKDGFMIRRGPFRSYEDERSQAFFTDIMDGYFPYELKEVFPQGVVFNLFDKSDKTFAETGDKEVIEKDKPQFNAFNGEGKRLGGNKDDRPPSENYRRNAPTNVKSLAQLGDPTISLPSNEFLNRLPDKVVENGNVVGVRSEVAGMLQGSKKDPNIIVVDTPVVQSMQGEYGQQSEESSKDQEENNAPTNETFRLPSESGSHRPVTPHDVTTIQVRSDSGRQVLVIKLRFDDTIGDLKNFIDRHRFKDTPYEIRTAFPAKAYRTMESTLRCEGLVPNATVMLRPMNPESS